MGCVLCLSGEAFFWVAQCQGLGGEEAGSGPPFAPLSLLSGSGAAHQTV